MRTSALCLVFALVGQHALSAQTYDGPGGATHAVMTVPSVIGRHEGAASEILDEHRLTTGRVEHRPSEQPAGIVIDQAPKAGASVKYGTSINLVVSTGPRETSDYKPEARPERETSGAGNGKLIGGLIGVAAGVAIAAAVHNARKPTTVPNVVGMSIGAATKSVEKASLKRGTLEVVNSEAPRGTVVKQSPGAETEVKKGTTVDLAISSGEMLVAVPDLVNADVEAATERLGAAQLQAGNVDRREVESQPGIVLAQSLPPGTMVTRGTAVGLTVSAPVTVVAAPPAVQPALPAPAPPEQPAPSPRPAIATPPRAAMPTLARPLTPSPTPQPASQPAPPLVTQPATPPAITLEPVPAPTPPASAPPPVTVSPAPVLTRVAKPPVTVKAGFPWGWLLVILFAALYGYQRWRAHRHPPATPTDPATPQHTASPPPVYTLRPRLDAGRQSIVFGNDRRTARRLEVALQRDAGRQRFGIHPTHAQGGRQ